MKALPLVLALALFVAAPAGAAVPASSPLQVAGHELRFGLSRLEVTRGAALVELVNFGEDDHDLRLRRVGGKRTYSLPVTRPGTRSLAELRLRPGRYRLWCSLEGHRGLGMRATLRVRAG